MNNVFKQILHWRDRNVSKRQLTRLNNHMLNDIGITRGDIGRVVEFLR
jgi:uncharacterized protein YjiS (DUF1127 family)